MIFSVDFDGTVVSQARDYEDVSTPFVFVPGAKEALQALKRAGHVLILCSARTNLSLWVDPNLDPLVRAGIRKVDHALWESKRAMHAARIEHMVEFCKTDLPGVFDAIDYGECGKMLADLFIDNNALRLGPGQLGVSWDKVVDMYGDRVA